MPFGPLWEDPDAACDAWAQDGPGPAVRGAAERLVADLGRARELTRDWSDQPLADALVDVALSECLAVLAATGIWGEANRLPSAELWRIAGELLEVGWLQHRARFKPLGYAGDYEMMVRICEEICCDDPLGRAFDRYFLRQAAPEAVRQRTRQTAAALADHRLRRGEGEYRVVSFGSGPGLDVAGGLGLLPEAARRDVRVTLLELDPAALEEARRRSGPLAGSGAVECVRTNLFRVARSGRTADALGRPDFLVCSGLFDYLDAESAAATLRGFWEHLAPGGLLLVGNFSPHNASRAYMEWIGNWYLTYRTPADLRRLAQAAGIPHDRFTVGCDPTGVILFLVGGKE